jgi:adiponectin receptor
MRVDYAGISLLILGSSFPPFYYGFYCDPIIRYLYLFTVGSACLAVYIISIFDFIHTDKWRRVKGYMYGSLGLFAGVPAFHLYLRE